MIQSAIQIGGLAIGSWLLHRISKPKSHEKAQLLARIAGDAARLLMAANPNAKWPDLLRQLVSTIAASAGLSVTDGAAIERAAASALWEAGKRPE